MDLLTIDTPNIFYLTTGYIFGYLTHKYSNYLLYNCYKQYVFITEYLQNKCQKYNKPNNDNKMNIVNMVHNKIDSDFNVMEHKFKKDNDFTVYTYKKNDKLYYSIFLLNENNLDVEQEEPIVSAYLLNETKNENHDITDAVNSHLLHEGFIVFDKNVKECYIKSYIKNYDENDNYYIEYISNNDFIVKKINSGILALNPSGVIHL